MLPITKNKIIEDFKDKFVKTHGKEYEKGNDFQHYETLVLLVRSYILKQARSDENERQKVYYFSLNELEQNLLDTNLKNLEIQKVCREALSDIGINLNSLVQVENDLRKGDELFSNIKLLSDLSVFRSGIRYKGDFRKCETELFKFLKNNPWEINKSHKSEEVKFYGSVEACVKNNKLSFIHKDYESVIAVPYDMPVICKDSKRVKNIRLWSAETNKELDFNLFSKGDYINSLKSKESVEEINSLFKYESNSYEEELLRLKQAYFLVSSNLKSIVREFEGNISDFHKDNFIKIRESELILVIPELMRILLDEENLSWESAWDITVNSVGFEMNNNIKDWKVDMVKILLPRVFMIINEINERYCRELWGSQKNSLEEIHKKAIVADGYIKIRNLIEVLEKYNMKNTEREMVL